MVLTSSRSSRGLFALSPLVFFQGFPSTMSGDGCSSLSGPTRALVESALLVWPPLDETEHVVSLLSVDDGEVIKLGRDLERLCKLTSLKLFLCCGTLDGLGLAAELREFPLRTDLIVLQAGAPATGGGKGKP